MKLPDIEIRTGAQDVQRKLAADILFGRLRPGAKLKLAEIGPLYAIGMSPLREALAGLAGQGLVMQEGQRGFRVADVSLADLMDVIAMRTRLEVMALEASIDCGDVEWEARIIASFHKLSRHKRTQEHLIDETWEDLHRSFHLSLIGACGSPRLFTYCAGLLSQFDRYRRIAVLARAQHAILTPMDGKIVDAALERDKVTAALRLRDHIAESGQGVVEMFGERMPRCA
ncbi:DNA-binding transcriptional regulator, GntR family [Arboricoccus pini]|uniref:DNA-binding transcriptional regulator, GntR family n=1 Tax=Arboricoccus pini TaxID=1963835 RepID=A0A212RYK1_9PROT|nr:FCD domain-containing protein [Arboricoccus pini]SNB77748.1 DNA-binding transcriptional regulator, GntR family [Arboricoccus pini]